MSSLTPHLPSRPMDPVTALAAARAADAGEAPDSVEAALNYLVDTGEKPRVFVAPIGTGEHQRTGTYADFSAAIKNGRKLTPPPSLDREGFALTRHATAVRDFYDEDEVKSVYYPEMGRLVKAATGAEHVLVFDHNRRIDGGRAQAVEGVRPGVRRVHNDYTAKSGPQRVRDLLDPAEAEARLKGRVAVVNVWRPIRGPVETAPLALADARSVAPKDLVATDLVYSDRVGEIYEATYNRAQRWYYFPKMERTEALLIKGYDSETDGRARFTPHTAFDDPTTPKGAAPRESIEVRTLAFFPPESDG